MAKNDETSLAEQIRGDMYGLETMKWHGWGSPVGLGLGVGLMLASTGLFLWLLHLADIIH